MTTQEQFCIIEVIEILQGIPSTETNATDFREIDEIGTLRFSRLSAKFKPFKGFLDGSLQFPVEKRRGLRHEYFIVSLFGGVIDNFAALCQEHHLICTNFNARTIRNDVSTATPMLFADLFALGENGGRCHIFCPDIIQPRIGKCAANGTNCCSYKTHKENLLSNCIGKRCVKFVFCPKKQKSWI